MSFRLYAFLELFFFFIAFFGILKRQKRNEYEYRNSFSLNTEMFTFTPNLTNKKLNMAKGDGSFLPKN